jgi:hypothetical protein
MKITKIFGFGLLSILFTLKTQAQTFTQTIRGSVIDIISQAPIPFATVILINSDPALGTGADINGNFQLKNVPVGMWSMKITCLGYKEQIVPNIYVISGKEVVLNVTLEENAIQAKEIEITANVEKNKPLNEFTTVSARTFSVEETQKFAAAVNDPARMSTAFAGVITTDDGNNNIAIRGNAPNGLLWRMEGVEIPNPNHFSAEGTSGGGISILSSQLLTNSDFLTGAFAAEYGNALSGVFDMKLRKGNNKKTERTVQLGFLGTDLAIEGPFKNNYNGSYLINYRYSTLSLLEKIGVNIGDATTNFQDLSYNIFIPTQKAGNFSLFGFGGLSNQYSSAKKDSLKWENNYDRLNWNFKSNTGAAGISHFIQLNNQSFLKTTLLASGSGKSYEEEKIDESYATIPQGIESNGQNKIALTSVFTKKIDTKNSLKAGVIAGTLFYDLNRRALIDGTNYLETEIQQKGTAATLQSFIQWNSKVSERLTFNTGVHSMVLLDNKKYNIEPRASVKYELSPAQSLSAGYGLHGQIQPIGVYFARHTNSDGNITQPNKNIGFTKAHHFVVAYDRSLSEYMHVKLETYYQYLFDVPVSTDTSNTFSMLNNEYGFYTDPLTNKGAGKNYGVELTLEQFLHHNLYFLLSSSIYNSKYRASNTNWYNTRFNGNFSVSLTGGKEFKTGKGFGNRIIGLNIKSIYSGGLRNTPIDYASSLQNGKTEYIESRPYELQAPDYFRTDVKFSVKHNRQKSTTTWSLDFQNVSNRKNVYGEYFDPLTGTTKTAYQAPLIPVLSYKIEF